MRMTNDILHYGMPRRSGRYPWGSGDRPYQSLEGALKGKGRSEYFQSKRTIPKGTKMYRTSINPNETTKGQPIYVSYTDVDRDLYKGGYIRIRDKSSKTYEYEFELNNDLKLPSRDEYKYAIKEELTKNTNLLKESVDSYFNHMFPENSFERMDITWNEELHAPDPKKWDKILKDSFEYLKDKPIEETWGMISCSLAGSNNLKTAIINNLKEKGFNAMVDEASVGGSGRANEGIDPLIVFDDSVLKTNNVTMISGKNESKSKKEYQKWKKKAQQAKQW